MAALRPRIIPLLGAVPVEDAHFAPLATHVRILSNDVEAWEQRIEQAASGNRLPSHTSTPRPERETTRATQGLAHLK
jgi:hypothetical protein